MEERVLKTIFYTRDYTRGMELSCWYDIIYNFISGKILEMVKLTILLIRFAIVYSSCVKEFAI